MRLSWYLARSSPIFSRIRPGIIFLAFRDDCRFPVLAPRRGLCLGFSRACSRGIGSCVHHRVSTSDLEIGGVGGVCPHLSLSATWRSHFMDLKKLRWEY